MSFLEKLGQKLKAEGANILKPHADQYRMAENLAERFEPVDEGALVERGEAMLSFIREHCIRGNARKFQIMLDGRVAGKISLDAQCHINCSPGFHKLYVKLDSLKSPVVNIKAEAGQRYYFNIACTMEDGMICKRMEEKKSNEEE